MSGFAGARGAYSVLGMVVVGPACQVASDISGTSVMRSLKARFDMLRDLLEGASDQPALVRAFTLFARASGFEWFTYLSVQGNDTYGASNYPDAWQKTYLEQNLAEIDPVVQGTGSPGLPIAWSTSQLAKRATRRQWNFIEEARSFDIRSGISIPVFCGYGRRAILTLSSPSPTVDASLIADRYVALTFAALIDGYLRNLERGMAMRCASCPLTQAQRDCLIWLTLGKEVQDVAAMRRTSRRAVEFQLQSIRRKLNASTTYQAISLALRNGWI